MLEEEENENNLGQIAHPGLDLDLRVSLTAQFTRLNLFPFFSSYLYPGMMKLGAQIISKKSPSETFSVFTT